MSHETLTPEPAAAKIEPGPPRLPVLLAIMVGVLGIGSAVAIGEIISVFVGPTSAPLLAVNEEIVNLTQAQFKEFAVNTLGLGTNDKTVLMISVGVALLIFGVIAGLVSRRRAMPGVVLAIVLGIVGVYVVLQRDDLGQLGVLSPVGSLVGGVLVFRWLHRLALAAAAGEPEDWDGESRRKFLVTSAGVAVGAGIVGLGGHALSNRSNAQQSIDQIGTLVPADPAPRLPAGADFAGSGTPSFITSNADFYRIDTALTVPQVSAQSWSLKIHGMVDKEITFSYNDIRNRRLIERPVTLTCVSEPIGGPYISTSNFIGVPLRDLLLEAGVQSGAQQLFSTSVDGFTVGTPVDVLLDPNRGAMLAIGMNRAPLPVEHGFPARMVVPGLYGYVSATKWVVDMELTTWDKQAYWVPRGYSQQAPIKTESRIDKPQQYATMKPGSVTVAGIAWAQSKGIRKVEVRVDGGPWQDAQLSTEVSKNTWRMWRTTFQLRAGTHIVESRATDDTGYTQTQAQIGEIPDGATGWPSVTFTVAG
ncbi:MAG TPA: molybdopterin-dependent oxidoreductase [Pseudonocardiaceae bacterium]|nr:molybdopterin-dependent oxidoreductase [Pseudonocardiaceae bacterium]